MILCYSFKNAKIVCIDKAGHPTIYVQGHNYTDKVD